jgi:hypothetical protein
MDYLEIINDTTSLQYLSMIQYQNSLLKIPNCFLFEGHFTTFCILFGVWALDMLFDVTLWQYVRPIREEIKCFLKIKLLKKK